MKKTILHAAIASALLGAGASAWAQQTYGDVARVISSTPIYDRVFEPRRECRTEPVTVYEERRGAREVPREAADSAPSGAGALLGAIVGGVHRAQLATGRGSPTRTVRDPASAASRARDRRDADSCYPRRARRPRRARP